MHHIMSKTATTNNQEMNKKRFYNKPKWLANSKYVLGSPIGNTLLLLRGANFTDAMGNSVNVSGGISAITARLGTKALYFDGTGGSFIVNTGEKLHTSDFTIESWVNITSFVGSNHGDYSGAIISDYYWSYGHNSGFLFNVNADCSLSFLYSDGIWDAQSKLISASSIIIPGQWTHVAVSRSSNILRLFVGGVNVAEKTIESTTSVSNSTYGESANALKYDIGSLCCADGLRVSYLHGYLDNVRVTKGVALYTSNFVPPVEI